jgi:hypothetical protein
MEKEILEKIYLLRKIKPEDGFVESTKRSILELEEENVREKGVSFSAVLDFLLTPRQNSAVALAGAFAFLMVFGFLALPFFPYDYEHGYVRAPLVIESEEERRVAKENEMTVDVAERERLVNQDFAVLENSFREIQRQVLGTMIEKEEGVDVANFTDKEIIEYHIRKIEEGADEINTGIGVMTVESTESRDEEMLEEAKEALKEEDYGRAFDVIVDILSR